MEFGQRVILIGGSSNVGKTALAAHFAKQFGWSHRSTDRLARHPGRPWQPKPFSVPPHVAEHYLGLSDEELITSVLTHYQNIWPLIENLVRDHAEGTSAATLVLEGSAIWPTNVSSLRLPRVSAIWLTAGDELFSSRIFHESRYREADERGKEMIDKFLERTRRFNRLMMKEVSGLGLPYIVVEEGMTVEEVAGMCLSRMRSLLPA
jgi:2-phosphoglycerate kinase